MTWLSTISFWIFAASAPPSIISFVLTEEVRECPHAGDVCHLDNTRNFVSTAFNNLGGAVLAPALPIRM